MKGLLLFCVAGCLAVLLPGATSESLTLPEDFKTCKRGDDACLVEAVMGAMPAFVKGLPKFGVQSVDPMHVEEVTINQGSGPVQMKMTVKNQEVSGLGQVTVTSVHSEMTDENFKLEINGTIPTVTSLGTYKIGGKILVLPIRGQGKNNFTVSDVAVKASMRGKVVKREDEEYIALDEFLFDFSTSRMYINFENLFNGDKTLANSMAAILNDNWMILLEEMKPAIKESVGQLLKGVTDKVFSRVPYATLFPKE